MDIINRIKYFLITVLSGDMPVVLNMNISSPPQYENPLFYTPTTTAPMLISGNNLYI